MILPFVLSLLFGSPLSVTITAYTSRQWSAGLAVCMTGPGAPLPLATSCLRYDTPLIVSPGRYMSHGDGVVDLKDVRMWGCRNCGEVSIH